MFNNLDTSKLDFADGLTKSIGELKDGINQLLDGSSTLYGGLCTLLEKSEELVSGIGQLAEGAKALKDGASALYDGILQLKNGTPALVDGVTQLKDGAMQLNEGLKKFNEEGIEKIVNIVGGNLNGIVTRLKATIDVSKNYRNFSGISDDMDGQVKFIYRTDEVTVK